MEADYDADEEAPGIPDEQKARAKKRLDYLLRENRRARDIDAFDARTDDVTHAYTDTFYRDQKRDDPSDPMLYQANHLKPWAAVILAALSYGRFTPSVLPAAQRAWEPGAPEAIRRLVDEWLNSNELIAKTRRASLLSVNRGDAAFFLDIDWKIAAESPQAGIRVDVIGRKELLIDRCSKQSRISYIGMILQKPLAGGTGDKDDKGDESPSWAETDPKRKTYAYLYDLDRSIPVDKSQDGPDADDAEEKLGIYTCACIEPTNENEPNKFNVKSIENYEPIKVVDAYGRPVAPIVPVQLTPHPDFPLRGLPEALTPYNLIAPKNQLRSFQFQTARVDATRIRWYDPERVAQESIDKINSGDLVVDVPLKKPEGPTPTLDPIGTMLVPVNPDSTKVIEQGIESDRDTTSGMSPMLQGGSQGKGYATATEASAAAAYSEASISPLRTTLNNILCNLAETWLCMLAHVCKEKGLPGVQILNPDKSTTDIPVEWLLYPWNITMDNTGSTPMADQQRMGTWLQVYPILEEMLATLAQAKGGVDETGAPTPGNPVLAAFEEQAYSYLVTLARLPDGFRIDSLKAAAMEAPAEMPMAPPPGGAVDPNAPPPPPPGQMPIPPDIAALMGQGTPNAPA